MSADEKPILLLNDLIDEMLAGGRSVGETSGVLSDAMLANMERDIARSGVAELRLTVTAEQQEDGRWTAIAQDPNVPSFPQITATADTKEQAQEQVSDYVRKVFTLGERKRVDERISRGRKR